jgi:hypothetical protein
VDAYVVVCSTVEEYLHRVAEGQYLPIDSFAADERRDLRSEIERGRHGA